MFNIGFEHGLYHNGVNRIKGPVKDQRSNTEWEPCDFMLVSDSDVKVNGDQ